MARSYHQKETNQESFPIILARPMFPFGNTADVRPAYIQSFVQHTFLRLDGGSAESHLFAEVMWPQVHPQHHVIGKPVEVWCKDLYEPTYTNLFTSSNCLFSCKNCS